MNRREEEEDEKKWVEGKLAPREGERGGSENPITVIAGDLAAGVGHGGEASSGRGPGRG